MGNGRRIVFRIHAIRRMFERQISVEDVRQVLATGETVESYPQDLPYPSRLVSGTVDERPIHVVAADNTDDQEIIVVTAYEPSPLQWDPDFKRRKT
jgi:hypothetical protein